MALGGKAAFMSRARVLTATIAELRRGPMKVLRRARGRPMPITSRGKTVAYFLSKRAYDRLMDDMENLELVTISRERMGEPGIPTTIEELLKRYGSERDGES